MGTFGQNSQLFGENVRKSQGFDSHVHCWSLRLARSHYCQQLSLSVCASVQMSVCLSVTFLQIDSSFFVSRWNRSIFCPSFLHVALYNTLFFDFWFRPPNTQNLLPNIACDNATLPRRHPWLRSRHGSSAWGKSAVHWTSGPTLVAMATKFGLGVEI